MSGPAASARPACNYKAAADILSERDPVLRRLVAQAGPIRVNPPTETHFAALIRAVLYQQLAGAAAHAIHGRLIASLGGEVTPERFLSLSSQTLRAVGLSVNKAASMRDLAAKVQDGSVVLDPAGLRGQGDDKVVAMLAGSGASARGRRRCFHVSAAAPGCVAHRRSRGAERVRAGVGMPTPTPKQLRALGDPYRPYRSVVAWYCWRAAELYGGAAESALTS
jgi:DNA-3-methyladenine glycosylase II